MEVIFDFRQIESMEKFYDEAVQKLHLPDYFGRNLDALYDMLTGHIHLPVTIQFFHLSPSQLPVFEGLLSTMKDAAANTEGFTFTSLISPPFSDEK